MKQQTQSSFKSKGPDHQIRLTPVTGSSVSASGPWFPLTFLYAASILLALQVNSSCGCWCSDAGQEFGSAAPVFKACPVTTEGHVTLLTHTHTHTHTPPIGMSRDGCCETELQWHIWILLSTAAGSDSSPGRAGQTFSCSCLFACGCCCCHGACLCQCSLTNLRTGKSST